MIDEDWLRQAAIAALGESLLSDPDPRIRLKILETLAALKDMQALTYLINAFRREEIFEVRMAIMDAIQAIAAPSPQITEKSTIVNQIFQDAATGIAGNVEGEQTINPSQPNP